MESKKSDAAIPRSSSVSGTLPSASVKKKAPAPPAPVHSKSPSLTPISKAAVDNMEVIRSCTEHNFLTDVADVREMEKGLLVLLEDFHNGKLQVFGKGCTFQQMDQVRERQERLSRLHFDLDAQQQINSIDSDDAKDLTFRNLNKLVENLDELNNAVHELKSEAIPPKAVSTLSPKPKSGRRQKDKQ